MKEMNASNRFVRFERNEVIIDRETVIEKEHIDDIIDSGSKTVLLHKEDVSTSEYAIIYNTLQKDPTNSEKEAVIYIYRQLRNAEPPDEETARGIIDKLFFSEQRYSLGEVGRFRINKKSHEMSLGTFPEVKISEAREKLAEQKRLRLKDINPLLQGDENRVLVEFD